MRQGARRVHRRHREVDRFELPGDEEVANVEGHVLQVVGRTVDARILQPVRAPADGVEVGLHHGRRQQGLGDVGETDLLDLGTVEAVGSCGPAGFDPQEPSAVARDRRLSVARSSRS